MLYNPAQFAARVYTARAAPRRAISLGIAQLARIPYARHFEQDLGAEVSSPG